MRQKERGILCWRLLTPYLENKTVNQCFGANLKKHFLHQICYFLTFLKVSSTKNAENDYFDQHLGCTAHNGWTKYTTVIMKS